MASSGYVESGGYAGRHLYFEWGTQSVSSANNTRTIWYRLTAEGGSASWYYHYDNTLLINGDLVYEGPSQERVYDGDVLDEGTYTINQNNTTHLRVDLDGGIYYMYDNINAAGDWDLDIIPRYTTITAFNVVKRNETSVTVTWSASDSCDKIWYSINNGSTWTETSVYSTFNITGLSPNTTYNFKIRVRRADSQLTTDSGTVTQTTYKAPTQGLSTKDENSIQMNWHSDGAVDYVWYSKDNGSTWTAVGGGVGTDGAYVIPELTAGTTYNIITRLRRQSSQTTYDTTTSTQTTYDYPYCIETPDFIIGNQLTLKFYNPLGRYITVTLIGNNTTLSTDYTSGTVISGYNSEGFKNILYASIPNSQSATYKVKITYGSVERIRDVGNTYSIRGTEKPIFSDFTYQNVNTTVYNGGKTLYDLTGNNQIIVKGFSNIKATVTDANKATATYYANMKNYSLTVGTKVAENGTLTYPVDITANAVDGANVIVAAVDTRGTSTSVTKQATFKNYTDLTINNLSLARTNNGAGANVIINLNGALWNESFGAINNAIVSATFRYRKTNESIWSSEYPITTTTSGNTYSASITTGVTFDLDSSYYIEVIIKDYLQTKTATSAIGAGTPALTIYKDNVAIGNQYDTSWGGKLQIYGRAKAQQFIGSQGGEWIYSRDNAVCKNESTSSTGNYNPVFSQKTKNGEWSVGSLDYEDSLRFAYTTDENYSTSTNTNVNWELDTSGNFSIIAKNVYEKKSLSSKSHSGWGTNNDYVPDMSFIAWWNGAHDSANHANLTYAHEGIIQCKPTNLYNNSSGTSGTVSLSETAANFYYIEIFFRTNDGTDYVSSVRVYSPNGKTVGLNYVLADTGTSIYQKYAMAQISGTSITLSRQREHYYYNGSTVNVTSATTIYVVRVDGWK